MKKLLLILVLAAISTIGFASPVKSALGANGVIVEEDNKPFEPYWGLCFTAEQDNSTISMSGSPSNINLLYSLDGKEWVEFIPGTTTITLPTIGSCVWMKAGENGNSVISSVSGPTRTFVLTGRIAASGSLNSLANGKVNITTGIKYYSLFKNCTALVTAPELPSTSLAAHGYRDMFFGCSNLIKAPYLPAKTLTTYCYYCMFYNCRKLNSVEVRFSAFDANTSDWMHNVASSGTLYCPDTLGTNETIGRGSSRCPAGWTVVNID